MQTSAKTLKTGFKKPKKKSVGSNNWFEATPFSNIIEYEKRRAERIGSSACYVLIRLSDFHHDHHGHDSLIQLRRLLISTMNKTLTKTSLKCLISDTKIGILIPDISIKKARRMIEAMFRQLQKLLVERESDHLMSQIASIDISSYPVYNISNAYCLQGIPEIHLMKSSSVQREAIIRDTKVLLPFEIQWKKTVINGTSCLPKHSLLLHKTTGGSNPVYIYLKRIVDIVGAIILILISAPLMALIAILVKVTSRGPVFFSQTRVGYLGREFAFLKFRSMVTDNNDDIHQEYVKKLIKGDIQGCNQGDDETPVFKLKNDPRITAIGKILRPFSLDELPQFFNVLRGDMSLVGPRPPLPYEVCEYDKWHYRRIFDIKPGITGLWQISDRTRLTFDEMVRLDIKYTESWSFLLDFKILLSTFKAVLGSEGA